MGGAEVGKNLGLISSATKLYLNEYLGLENWSRTHIQGRKLIDRATKNDIFVLTFEFVSM